MDILTIRNFEEYQAKVQNGTLTLLCEGDGNWDYYMNENRNYVYYIAKKSDCMSGMFGDIKHFLHAKINLSRFESLKINKAYQEDLEVVLRKYANYDETKRYFEIVEYVEV